jgi:hypothetical protein
MGIKKVTGPLSSLRDTFASHRTRIFALDYPGLSAYQITGEGTAQLAWKKTGPYFLHQAAANDRWFVATRSETFSDSPGTPISREDVTFHVFDIIKGDEIFVFTEKFSQAVVYHSVPLWLKDDFLIILVGPELHIFHILTKTLLTSIPLSNALTHPHLIYSINCSIHLVQIDQQVLRIIYEHKFDNNDLQLKVHEIRLENQHGRTFSTPPQILAALSPSPPEPTRGQRFKDFIYTILSLPFRFLRWVRSLFLLINF